jgi:3-deoxy-D-manno-octulosonic-acid transferase|tara:strand:+ start:1317 stop:2582 length:1266 start_codon:yes stop_codon:yes gene_type:complete
MYFWYKIFTYLFYPFSRIYLKIRKFKKKEDSIRYEEKLSKISIKRDEGFLIWLHVASVGEAMSVIPLIEDCINNKNINKVLLTSITLSSGKILEKKYNKNKKITHQYLPLDIPVLVKKFLNHWKPNLSVFIDSEIWPNLILEINKKKIPLVLLNARITKKTYVRWKLAKNFAKKIFEKFDLCIASNKESENFLHNLGAKNIKNFGNLKFSSIKNNIIKELDPDFLIKIKGKKIWCAASTHSPEEILCAKLHASFKNSFNNVLTIIIPRHINRVNEIFKEIQSLNLNVILSSQLNKFSKDTDIILVDSYGQSLKFYNISKYTFLGKSFIESLKLDSGQNPIEPARMGCKIFYGPYVSNFDEIYEYFKALGVAQQVDTIEELSSSLIREFKEEKVKNKVISKKIDDYGQNIFNNVILELKKYI